MIYWLFWAHKEKNNENLALRVNQSPTAGSAGESSRLMPADASSKKEGYPQNRVFANTHAPSRSATVCPDPPTRFDTRTRNTRFNPTTATRPKQPDEDHLQNSRLLQRAADADAKATLGHPDP